MLKPNFQLANDEKILFRIDSKEGYVRKSHAFFIGFTIFWFSFVAVFMYFIVDLAKNEVLSENKPLHDPVYYEIIKTMLYPELHPQIETYPLYFITIFFIASTIMFIILFKSNKIKAVTHFGTNQRLVEQFDLNYTTYHWDVFTDNINELSEDALQLNLKMGSWQSRSKKPSIFVYDKLTILDVPNIKVIKNICLENIPTSIHQL
jgi:hypothetical protein